MPEHVPPADFSPEELRIAFLLGRQHGGFPFDIFVLEILRPVDVGGRFAMAVLIDQDRIPLALADGEEFSTRLAIQDQRGRRIFGVRPGGLQAEDHGGRTRSTGCPAPDRCLKLHVAHEIGQERDRRPQVFRARRPQELGLRRHGPWTASGRTSCQASEPATCSSTVSETCCPGARGIRRRPDPQGLRFGLDHLDLGRAGRTRGSNRHLKGGLAGEAA